MSKAKAAELSQLSMKLSLVSSSASSSCCCSASARSSVSWIVVIVLLPSLSTFYGDKIITLQDNKGSVTLSGQEYTLEKTNNDLTIGTISCSLPCTTEIGSHNYKVMPEGNGIKFAMIVAVLPVSLPFLGNMFGWLGWYIICSMPLVIIIRKAMKIYM